MKINTNGHKVLKVQKKQQSSLTLVVRLQKKEEQLQMLKQEFAKLMANLCHSTLETAEHRTLKMTSIRETETSAVRSGRSRARTNSSETCQVYSNTA